MTQALADQLSAFAVDARRHHLSAIIARLRRPVRIAVEGRAGVGRGKVETAMERRGAVVAHVGEPFDVLVLVAAETLKPEDVARLQTSRRPALVVVTKADLSGPVPDGPIATARARAAALRATAGVPVVAVVGLLAALDPAVPLDREVVAALQAMLVEPADLSSVDAFVDGAHPVGSQVRAHLIDTLDRFGIAHALVALTAGVLPGDLPARLHSLGNLDEAMAALDRVAAPVRYRRVLTALAELRCVAVQSDDDELAELLASDATVLAAMSAAVDVVTAAGLTVDPGDTRAAHLQRAVRWRRYGGGPVNELHRQCSADIARGSVRLLAAAGRPSA